MEPQVASLIICNDLNSSEFDAIVVVAPDVKSVAQEKLKNPLNSYVAIDKSGPKGIFVVPCDLPAKKIIFSGTGSIDNDYDDVRSFAKAAKNGVKKALETGSKSPLLLVQEARFPEAGTVAILGALEALYVPLEVREEVLERAVKSTKLGIFGDKAKIGSKVEMARMMEMGRVVTRDIGGSDPERMAAPR